MHPGQFHAFHCTCVWVSVMVNFWHRLMFLDNWPVSVSLECFFPSFFLLTEMAFDLHTPVVYSCGPHSLLLLSYTIIQSFLLYMQINSAIQPVYTTNWGLDIWAKGLTMYCIWQHQSHPDTITANCKITFFVYIQCTAQLNWLFGFVITKHYLCHFC